MWQNTPNNTFVYKEAMCIHSMDVENLDWECPSIREANISHRTRKYTGPIQCNSGLETREILASLALHVYTGISLIQGFCVHDSNG